MFVAIAIAAGFAATLLFHGHVPTLVTIALLGVLSAWYGSLQHEVIHGHPTPWSSVNHAFAAVPINVFMYYDEYRSSHLAHHATAALTDPDEDDESFFVTSEQWQRRGRVGRALSHALFTLVGRLVLGPVVVAATMWQRRLRSARSAGQLLDLARHGVAAAAVLGVVHASGLSWWVFLLGASWMGMSVTLLRSFAEHRSVLGATRSAVVHANRFFALLFLNNNLHHTHHARPGVAWYGLPRVHSALGSDAAAAAGAGLYRGYASIVWLYAFRPFAHPVYDPTPVLAASASTTAVDAMLNGPMELA